MVIKYNNNNNNNNNNNERLRCCMWCMVMQNATSSHVTIISGHGHGHGHGDGGGGGGGGNGDGESLQFRLRHTPILFRSLVLATLRFRNASFIDLPPLLPSSSSSSTSLS